MRIIERRNGKRINVLISVDIYVDRKSVKKGIYWKKAQMLNAKYRHSERIRQLAEESRNLPTPFRRSLHFGRDDTLAFFILLLALLQIIFGIGKVLTQRNLLDFSVYYEYSRLFTSGKNPYELSDMIPLNYPPSSLLFFIPFSLIPQKISEALFTIFSISFFLFAIRKLLLVFKIKLSLQLLLLAALLQNFPAKFTLVLGQVNLIILSLGLLSWIFDQKGKNLISGVFVSLSILIKPLTFPLLFYFLFRKKFKTFFISLGIITVINIIMVIIFPYLSRFFLERLPYFLSQTGTAANLYDQSLRAFLYRAGITDYKAALGITLVLFSLVFYKFRKIRKIGPIGHNLTNLKFFSLILAVSSIGGSFTWQHHLVLLFPGFVAETIYLLKKKNFLRGIILLISAILVGYHFPDIANPPTTNPILVSHALVGSLVLIGLLL